MLFGTEGRPVPLASYTTDISTQHGRIWHRKPGVSATGVVATIVNVLNQRLASPLAFTCVAFSAFGGEFAVGDARGQVTVFFPKQNRFFTLKKAGPAVRTLAFSSERRHDLAVSLENKTVEHYNIDSHQLLACLKEHRYAVGTLSFHPHGGYCVTSAEDAVILWDCKSWRKQRSMVGLGIVQAKFYPTTGSMIVTLFSDGSLTVWDFSTFEARKRLPVPVALAANSPHSPPSPLHVFDVSRRETHLLAGGTTPLLCLWDLLADVYLGEIRLSESHSTAQIRFTATNDVAAVLDGNPNCGGVHFVNTRTRQRVLYLPPPGRAVILSFALDSDDKWLASCLSTGEVQLHDLAVLRRVSSSSTGGAPVALSRADPQLATGADDDHHAQPTTTDSFVLNHRVSVRPAVRSAAARASRVLDSVFPPAPPPQWTNSWYDWQDDVDGPTKAMTHAPVGPVEMQAASTNPRRAQTLPSKRPTTASDLGPLAPIDRLQGPALALNLEKLRVMLETFGEYPEKYRLLVWRFLLHLPDNHDSYNALNAKGVHPACRNLLSVFPVKNRGYFKKLERQLSCLCYWSPVFGEVVSWVAPLVFPFVMAFGHDDLSCFETLLSFFTNWGADWFEFAPAAPDSVLRRVDAVLATHHRALWQRLRDIGVDVEVYVWPVLRTLFSEVLTRTEWLKAMDHVFSNEPGFLLHLVAAYLGAFSPLLCACRSFEDIETFLHQTNACNINNIIRSAYKSYSAPASPSFPEVLIYQPLPDGQYPIFNKFPRYIVNHQKQTHERISQHEEAVKNRKNVERELRSSLRTLEARERSHARQLEKLKLAEAAYAKEQKLQQQVRNDELSSCDAEITNLRLSRNALLERQSTSDLQAQRALLDTARTRQQLETDVTALHSDYLRSHTATENVLSRLDSSARSYARSASERNSLRVIEEPSAPPPPSSSPHTAPPPDGFAPRNLAHEFMSLPATTDLHDLSANMRRARLEALASQQERRPEDASSAAHLQPTPTPTPLASPMSRRELIAANLSASFNVTPQRHRTPTYYTPPTRGGGLL
eukprot:gnl/Spiro4/14668_TR7904_c0_g1_i1.p1 gnl/Spiro4/14668_TR7904_c0_g1~~gnl/Spiro4/14668_TR7904_c0_g1_i1.p1  ORF type:complete len:1065 (+),score=303.07 gnl/Spiro4/14668_TR7904_c0_g1_i1:53-3196(+)